MNASRSSPVFRILVADDLPTIHDDFRKILLSDRTSPALRDAATALFGHSGMPAAPVAHFSLDAVFQGVEALRLVEAALVADQPFALAFVDMRMPPGWDGIETIRQLWAVDPALQICLCTAYSDYSWHETISALGHTDNLIILKKPFDSLEVLQLTHALTRKWQLARENAARLASLDESVRQRTKELRDSEERFARMFQANPVPISLQQRDDGRYLDANPAFFRLIGHPRDRVLQHTAAELGLWLTTDPWSEVLRSLDAQAPLRAHPVQLCQGDGNLRQVLLSVEQADFGTQRCVLTSLEDITDRTLLEQQFRHAQKMEAVGQLAAGVAHDFNNLLTVVQVHTSYLLEDLPLTDEQRTALNQVRAAGERAAALTRQLLVFSRRQLTQPEPLDLAETFAALHEMLDRLLPAEIKVEWHCASNAPRIYADEASIEQVVMNLVVNARDAMPGGGTIRISLQPAHLEAGQPLRHPDARPGLFARISVADTGTGIEPDVLGRIFEPFFTTKGIGKGTGLGLSTVYGIVSQYDGWIEVASTPGSGTTFDIFIPALDKPAAPRTARRLLAPETSSLEGHGERILLVEDELTVRVVARALIERAGYHVTEASDAPSAIEAWKAAPQPFDLLLTDMVMPNGATGAELAAQLCAQNPSLKVILTTGYSHDLLKRSAQALAGARLLLKPFSRAPLLAIIRETLDTPAGEPPPPAPMGVPPMPPS